MIAPLVTWAWLVLVFLALFESLTPAAVAGGSLVAAALVGLFPRRRGGGGPVRVHPVALWRYAWRFTIRLVQANVQVAWAVIVPSRAGLRRGIVAVPVAPSSDAVLSLLAISLSLTPGTSIIHTEHDPPVLYVHVLQLRGSLDAVRAGVLQVQRELVEALGPADALHDIDRRLADLLGDGAAGGAQR